MKVDTKKDIWYEVIDEDDEHFGMKLLLYKESASSETVYLLGGKYALLTAFKKSEVQIV